MLCMAQSPHLTYESGTDSEMESKVEDQMAQTEE